jgi:transposase InsO family protein
MNNLTLFLIGTILMGLGATLTFDLWILFLKYLFDDLEEVRTITEHWLEQYNTIRPHEALQGLPPGQYAIQNA